MLTFKRFVLWVAESCAAATFFFYDVERASVPRETTKINAVKKRWACKQGCDHRRSSFSYINSITWQNNTFLRLAGWNTDTFSLLNCCYEASASPSEHLLRVAAEDLQAQGDAVDPTQRVDPEVAAEQRGVKYGDRLFIWIVVTGEDLRKGRKGKGFKFELWCNS